jgi:hypothetical protein
LLANSMRKDKNTGKNFGQEFFQPVPMTAEDQWEHMVMHSTMPY